MNTASSTTTSLWGLTSSDSQLGWVRTGIRIRDGVDGEERTPSQILAFSSVFLFPRFWHRWRATAYAAYTRTCIALELYPTVPRVCGQREEGSDSREWERTRTYAFTFIPLLCLPLPYTSTPNQNISLHPRPLPPQLPLPHTPLATPIPPRRVALGVGTADRFVSVYGV